jgi:hypothetical protein
MEREKDLAYQRNLSKAGINSENSFKNYIKKPANVYFPSAIVTKMMRFLLFQRVFD